MIGDDLKATRRARGISVRGLASLSGVNHQTIYDVEADARDPLLSTIQRMSDALGCELVVVDRQRLADFLRIVEAKRAPPDGPGDALNRPT